MVHSGALERPGKLLRIASAPGVSAGGALLFARKISPLSELRIESRPRRKICVSSGRFSGAGSLPQGADSSSSAFRFWMTSRSSSRRARSLSFKLSAALKRKKLETSRRAARNRSPQRRVRKPNSGVRSAASDSHLG